MLQKVSMRYYAKFRDNRSNRDRNIGLSVFRFSKMAAVRFGESICISISKFLPIGQTVVHICPFFDFSRGRPSAILDLLYAYLGPPMYEEQLMVFIVKQNLVGIGHVVKKIKM